MNIWKKENKRLRVASIHRGHTASLRLAGGHLTGLGHAAKAPCEGLEPPNLKDHRSSGAACYQLHQHGRASADGLEPSHRYRLLLPFQDSSLPLGLYGHFNFVIISFNYVILTTNDAIERHSRDSNPRGFHTQYVFKTPSSTNRTCGKLFFFLFFLNSNLDNVTNKNRAGRTRTYVVYRMGGRFTVCCSRRCATARCYI